MGSKECRNRVDIGRFDSRRPDDAPLFWHFVGDVRLSCTSMHKCTNVSSSRGVPHEPFSANFLN